MALAKKGSRLLTVELVRYRWVVTPGDEPGLGIVVEDADSPGQRMVTWVEHGTVIAPWLVREAILHALARGWQPRARGPERVFRLDTKTVTRARGERLSAKLYALCDVFEAREPGLGNVRDLIDHGELVIAFEDFCSYFFDVERMPELSLAELEQIAWLGEELGCRSHWVFLIECLAPEDRKRLPLWLRPLAAAPRG
jgi:hypothetical protein